MPNPLSAYGRSKLLGERQLEQSAGLRWLVVRTSALFGVRGYSFPHVVLTRAREGQELQIVDDQVTAPTYAADLADAALDLAESGARGIWHVTNSGTATWYDFAHAILQEFGVQCRLAAVTTAQWQQLRPGQAKRPAYGVLDCCELARHRGQAMRHWRAALSGYRTARVASGELP